MIAKCKLLEPFSCKENDSVMDVAKKLSEFHQRHIYVVNDEDYPIGVISVTDLLERLIAAGKDPKETSAKDVMTSNIDVFDDEDDAKQAYKVMSEKHIVSVPVTQNKKFVGTLTFNEALNFVTHPENF